MSISYKWISSVAATAAVSLFSLSSHAAEPVGNAALSTTVKTWDLNLARSEDMQTLHERVREAANSVCAAEERRHWSTTRRTVPAGWRERCVSEAVETAVREVGDRRLAINTTGNRALL